jgi:hypothetical protein
VRKLSLILAVLLLGVTASVASAAHTWMSDLAPGRDATQAGKVTITEINATSFRVTLDMTPAPDATTQQPAHIHVGGCPGVGAVAFPLTNVVNGKSETTVNASLKTVLGQQHAINVHRSAAEVAVYTACVDLPAGNVMDFGPGRDATQAGYVVFGNKGAQTRVSLVMVPGAAGAAQPAHIHVDRCPGVGAVAFPLTNVVGGSSETMVNTTWAQLQSRQHSVNVHRSAAEVAVYTACVDIPLAQQAAAPVAAAPTQLPRTGGAPLGLVALLGAGLAGLGTALRRR